MEPKWAVAISPDGFDIQAQDGTSFDMSEEDGLEGVVAVLNALETEREELRAALEEATNDIDKEHDYLPEHGCDVCQQIARYRAMLSRLQPESAVATNEEAQTEA